MVTRKQFLKALNVINDYKEQVLNDYNELQLLSKKLIDKNSTTRQVPISCRARNILNSAYSRKNKIHVDWFESDLKVLDFLSNLSIEDVSDSRNCGKKTMEEISMLYAMCN